MTTNFNLVPGLRMSGAIPPFSLYVFTVCTGQLYFHPLENVCYSSKWMLVKPCGTGAVLRLAYFRLLETGLVDAFTLLGCCAM